MITTPDRFIKLVPLNWSDHAMWCEGLTLLVNRASSKTPVYEQFRLVDATPVSAADTTISIVQSPALMPPPEAICAPPSADSEIPSTQTPKMRRRATVTAPLSSFFRRWHIIVGIQRNKRESHIIETGQESQWEWAWISISVVAARAN
ncbi:hypothetical protein HK096_004747 [Nowakowskiella sp. JEL0078]|nr:hypothetical protein HK096_004747 [Nowakowskiella sp. JEL0078]